MFTGCKHPYLFLIDDIFNVFIVVLVLYSFHWKKYSQNRKAFCIMTIFMYYCYCIAVSNKLVTATWETEKDHAYLLSNTFNTYLILSTLFSKYLFFPSYRWICRIGLSNMFEMWTQYSVVKAINNQHLPFTQLEMPVWRWENF